jgi:glycosyltransferase involved in cell wall biosynthesis
MKIFKLKKQLWRNKMKPKICFVSPEIYPVLVGDSKAALWGGAEVQQTIIIRELDKRKYDIPVITMDFGQDDLIKLGRNIKVYKACKPTQGIKFIRHFHPISTSIWKLLEKIDADIYYQRAPSMITGIVAYFCKKKGKKFIYSLAHDKDASARMTAEYNAFSMFRDVNLFKYGIMNADVVVCQNQYQKEMLKKNFKINGIIIKSANRSIKKTKNNNHKDILWVGKIIDWKRPELFVKLSQSFPQCHFVLVGGALGENTLNQVKTLATNKNIDMIGFIPYSKIDSYFDKAKMFVNTSESEGFPNTFLQAWSRGIPVVSSVDPSNIIKRNNLGYFCKSFDDFENGIRSLLKNNKEYSEISNNCRTYFEKNHSIKKTVDGYERLFAKLMKNEI